MISVTSKIRRRLAAATAATAVFAGLSQAGAGALGTYSDWAAHTDGDGKERTCWIYSVPKSQKGDYSKRGRVYAIVTHRPGDKVRDQVQFTAGYPFKEGSAVEVEVDGRKFALFTNDDTAWARNPKDDGALVEAMRAGRRMTVKGTSSRGTLTTDSYSLSGFTAAHKAIGKACGIN